MLAMLCTKVSWPDFLIKIRRQLLSISNANIKQQCFRSTAIFRHFKLEFDAASYLSRVSLIINDENTRPFVDIDTSTTWPFLSPATIHLFEAPTMAGHFTSAGMIADSTMIDPRNFKSQFLYKIAMPILVT